MSEKVKDATATDTPKADAPPVVQPDGQVEQQKGEVKQTTEAPKEGAKPVEKIEFKLPEGSYLDQSHLDKLSSYAQEKGLSKEMATTLLERENSVLAEYVTKQIDTHETSVKKWAELSKADKELGGEAFAKNVELAHRALEKFGSPELKKALDETGYGNHPEMVRFMYRIGKAMGDDGFVSGTKGVAKKSIAEILYGSTTKGE